VRGRRQRRKISRAARLVSGQGRGSNRDDQADDEQ
jgi:hypothetical protein